MAVGEQVGEQAAEGQADELISFVPLEDENGIDIVDHIERRHFSIYCPTSGSPTSTSTEPFQFPVSSAVSIFTTRLHMPQRFGAIIRNSLGFMVAEITAGETRSFPPDRYSIDPGASIKTYITFEGGFSVDSSAEGLEIRLDSSTEVHIGARSHHKQPAGRITTTGDFQNVANAISHMSSSLKTLSCERSYPTLRGHPPTIELGETLEIPPSVTRPDSGIMIELPRDMRYLFGISPLAFYLAAEIQEGPVPRILTDSFEYSFNANIGEFEDEVERILKQVFFFDCITRTEGLFQVNLKERNAIAEKIGFSIPRMYGKPIATQIEAYLDTPYQIISPHVPQWKLTAHVNPSTEFIEYLPFVANELGIVKTTPREIDSLEIDASTPTRHKELDGTNGQIVTNSTASSPNSPGEFHDKSIESAWMGSGTPRESSKAMLEAFYNRVGRKPADEDIDITVICNANEMGGEIDIINEVYGSRETLPFDISTHRNLAIDQLREVIEQDTEFLHYIGHIDSAGFECPDGRFDASTLDSTGVDVFFLNACRSHDQGRHLIEAGSIAGVVTQSDVINSGAQRIGATLARLLNCGFPLQAALKIARKESIMGGHYHVIGDGGIEVTQPEGSPPAIGIVDKLDEEWKLQYYTFPTSQKGMGTITSPPVEKCDEYYINSGPSGEFILSKQELHDLIAVREMPLQLGEELLWTSEFSV